jgi:hypothetical protein
MMIGSYYNVEKTFLLGIVARDIGEPLPSFDAATPAAEARALLEQTGAPVVGIRTRGFVNAYAELTDLTGGACGDCARPLDPARVLPDTALLGTVIHALNDAPYVFVRQLGVVSALVTRADLEEPPVRMWLFGLLSSLAARFVALIAERFGDTEAHAAAGWVAALSPARLEKAQILQAERRRRQLDDTLLGCLQFADKAQIIARDEPLRQIVGLPSRKNADRWTKDLELLRNNLAHGQAIVVSDWDVIVRLVENLEQVMRAVAGGG